MDEALALIKAVEVVGSQTEAAKIVNRSPQAISEVIRRGAKAPAEWCIPLERATMTANAKDSSKPVITRHQLRPDLYPIEECFDITASPPPLSDDTEGATL